MSQFFEKRKIADFWKASCDYVFFLPAPRFLKKKYVEGFWWIMRRCNFVYWTRRSLSFFLPEWNLCCIFLGGWWPCGKKELSVAITSANETLTLIASVDRYINILLAQSRYSSVSEPNQDLYDFENNLPQVSIWSSKNRIVFLRILRPFFAILLGSLSSPSPSVLTPQILPLLWGTCFWI